jgi:perosamine synthetase
MIPVSEPNIAGRELELVTDAVQSGWISSAGKYIDAFEVGFAVYHGVSHCVALTNGTAALEVALHAVGVDAGDEVIIPSFTIMSLALAVLRIGAVPRVADVDPDSWNLTAEGVAQLINARTRAIIVVHGFGQPADMDPILGLARAHDLRVIEDTAESIGSRYKGRLCGTMGDVGSFSLYANKLITTGEGGCILTDNDEYASRARRFINLYFGLTERFSHEGLGYNFRMTNMQAAIGVAQLEQIETFAARKREIGQWYAEALADCDTVTFQKTVGDVDHVYWMYCMVLRDHIRMDAMAAMAHLGSCGIGTRNLFKGLHAQGPLRPHLVQADRDAAFPVTEHLYARGFYVPSAVTLTREDVARVVTALKELR